MNSAPNTNDVALFIDWENFKFSLADTNREPSITPLLEIAKREGRLVLARAYANWQDHSHRGDASSLYYAGVEPIYVPTRGFLNRGGPRRNSVDVKLAVDCMGVDSSNPNIKTYILVTGDADFIHLCSMLRTRGSRVVLVAVSGHTANRLAESVDELIYYEEESSERPRGTTQQSHTLDEVRDLLMTIIREQRAKGSYPLLSWIGLELRKRIPTFDHREYGFEKFKNLLLQMETDGALKIATFDLLDYALLPEDERPESLDEIRQSWRGNGRLVERSLPFEGEDEDDDENAGNRLESDGAMGDLIRTMLNLERKYPFVTRGFLASCLERNADSAANNPHLSFLAGPELQRMSVQAMHRLIDDALEEGILTATEAQDPRTGEYKSAVELVRQHDQVSGLVSAEGV